MSKTVEFCIFGRNDDYTFDFLYRIETCINYFIESVKQSSLQGKVFLSVLDWGSKSQIVNSINLNDNYEKIVKFYYISETQIKNLGCSNNAIPISLPWNILIRRSTNSFLFGMGADTLITNTSLTNLYNLINSENHIDFNPVETLLLIERKHIPWRFFINCPDILQINNYIQRCSYLFKSESLHAPIGASCGVIGMSKSLWFKTGGLDERFTRWGGNDMELIKEVSNENEWIDLSFCGVSSFHIEHCPDEKTSKRNSEVAKKRVLNPYLIEDRKTKDFGASHINLSSITKIEVKKKIIQHKKLYGYNFVKNLNTLNRLNDKIEKFCEDLCIKSYSKRQYNLFKTIVKLARYNSFNTILSLDRVNYLNYMVAGCFFPTSILKTVTKPNFGKNVTLQDSFFSLIKTGSFQGYPSYITRVGFDLSVLKDKKFELYILDEIVSDLEILQILQFQYENILINRSINHKLIDNKNVYIFELKDITFITKDTDFRFEV